MSGILAGRRRFPGADANVAAKLQQAHRHVGPSQVTTMAGMFQDADAFNQYRAAGIRAP